jgi:PPM family protein phosphatase
LAVASRPLEIAYATRTDVGRQRQINEDFVFADALLAKSGGKEQAWLLLVVADGVGGHQRGEWASQTAVGILRDTLPELLEAQEPSAALKAACEAANSRTWREALASGLDGSATTLVVALINDEDKMWLANVGDSRAYLVHDAAISRLTTDHSWVEEQVQSGRMTVEEARTSDQRNIITRSVGFSETVEVDVDGPMSLTAGERLLLCSDGLYDQVSDDEIAATVSSARPDQAARRLVDLANERGGPDNVSVIVCSIDSASSPAQATTLDVRVPRRHAFGLWLALLFFAALASVAAALVVIFAF